MVVHLRVAGNVTSFPPSNSVFPSQLLVYHWSILIYQSGLVQQVQGSGVIPLSRLTSLWTMKKDDRRTSEGGWRDYWVTLNLLHWNWKNIVKNWEVKKVMWGNRATFNTDQRSEDKPLLYLGGISKACMWGINFKMGYGHKHICCRVKEPPLTPQKKIKEFFIPMLQSVKSE